MCGIKKLEVEKYNKLGSATLPGATPESRGSGGGRQRMGAEEV